MLSKNDIPVTILEADPRYVGGISRTVRYNGFHFDIGGHRFFSKSKEVEDLWTELLPDDMLDRPRSSRIFYNNYRAVRQFRRNFFLLDDDCHNFFRRDFTRDGRRSNHRRLEGPSGCRGNRLSGRDGFP